MDKVLEQIAAWPDASDAERAITITNVRRYLLAAMESGNTQSARTILLELADVNLQASFSLRAELVGAYGMDI